MVSERWVGELSPRLTEVLNERFSNSEIRGLLFKHGLDDRYQGANKADRLSEVFHPLVSQRRYDSQCGADGLPYEDYEGEAGSTWDVIDEVAEDALPNPGQNE